ncbi:hypothetical protein [Nostoc sp. FACHB-110]|uniref:hypothetical protein n=1 Tax=Nostoc sp. FACHB-110 TaxID=2692834 RepID=UPI001689CFB3|nr:hypothetical protein [Nostoc sp. FACHB-110]MBD2436230.1 hypothetical protein [Nostoc sp. FACHB-110]
MLQDDFNYCEDNPQDVYLQTQINTLNDLEGIHEYQPDKSALVISVALSVIETVIAFTMIAPAGIFIASMVSLFPVVLLWAIANHHAEKVELPEAYDELVEKYHETVQK